MQQNLCFLTVTHKGDLEAFRLLRKSLRAFAPDIRHVVIVDDEQFDFYRNLFGKEPHCEFLSSRQVLPARLEYTRKLVRRTRGGLLEKIAVRLGFDPSPFTGWCLQQLLKMHFLAAGHAEVVVFLDSDLLLTQPFKPESLFEDGLLILPEAPALSVEDYGFESSARVMLGENRGSVLEGRAYIHQPPRFYSRTGRALVEAMTEANKPAAWEYRFIRQQWPSEYHLLGRAVHALEQAKGYRIKPFNAATDTYEIRFAQDVEALETVLSQCLAERGKRGYLLVQSNLRIHSDALCARMDRLLEDLQLAHATSV